MTITPEKYVRKPLIVLGVQVTNENFMELALWVQGSIFNIDGTQGGQINPDKQYIMVRVHNPKSPRQSKAFVGDWVLYSERGYKVYTPKAFNNTFDPLQGVEKDKATQAKKGRVVNENDITVDEYIDEKEKDETVRYPRVEDGESEEERLDRLDNLHGQQNLKVGGDGD